MMMVVTAKWFNGLRNFILFHVSYKDPGCIPYLTDFSVHTKPFGIILPELWCNNDYFRRLADKICKTKLLQISRLFLFRCYIHDIVHIICALHPTQRFIIYSTPSTNSKPNHYLILTLSLTLYFAKFIMMSNYLRKIGRHIDVKPGSCDLTNVA